MLIALRHAAPVKSGICAGRFDLSVHDAEPELATILNRLQSWGVDCIFSSPALRCRAVADRLARALSLSVHLDSRLRELNFGEWEGQLWSEIQAEDRDRFEYWCQYWREASPPGGEKVSDLESRVREWLWDAPKSNVVVCAHAGTIRALQVLVHGQSWEAAMADPVPYLVPVVIQ